MPTIMSHAVIPIAAAVMINSSQKSVSQSDKPLLSKPIMFLGMALAMLPDADVVGFALGINYGDALGHRGASHAILVAAAVAALISAILRPLYWRTIFGFLFLSMASHGILDAFTNGGLGAALFWPIDDTRYFAPFAPIEVSPIGRNFFSERGLITLWSELKWIILPAFIITYCVRFIMAQRHK